MALVDVGTDATTTLTGVVWPASIADAASIGLLILDDLNVDHPIAAISGIGGLSHEGILSVPNRGQMRIYPGDIIAVDPATGGVILITALAAAGGDWNVA